jgi:acetyl esterase/lipase
LQKLLAQPVDAAMPPPKTTEEWKALSEHSVSSEQASAQELALLRARFGVSVVPQMMGGVHCYIVTPTSIQPKNRNRLIVNLHHGGFIWGGGQSGTEWAIELAGLMGYRVLVVDYRLLPDHPFPAALDDAVTVWKEVIKATKPSNIAVLGGSAGGGLVLSLIQRAKSDRLPLPRAVVSISPAADLSKTGDSYYTNAGVDGTVVYDGFWETVFKFYANGRDLRDPAISPVYGDFKGFPPTYLVTGTRDLFLSDTVRVQRKLLQAGVSTQLEVLEGLPHPGFLMVDIPEVRDMYSHVAQFIDALLGH